MNTTVRFQSISPAPLQDGHLFQDVVTVKRIITVSAFLIAFALTALGVSTAQGQTMRGWNSSFSAAQAIAKEANRPLLLVIVKEGCPACANHKDELTKPSSVRALRNAVKVEAEASYNPDLVSQFAAGGTPTTLLFSPDTGFSSPVFSYTGAMSAGDIRSLGQSINSLAGSR